MLCLGMVPFTCMATDPIREAHRFPALQSWKGKGKGKASSWLPGAGEETSVPLRCHETPVATDSGGSGPAVGQQYP